MAQFRASARVLDVSCLGQVIRVTIRVDSG